MHFNESIKPDGIKIELFQALRKDVKSHFSQKKHHLGAMFFDDTKKYLLNFSQEELEELEKNFKKTKNTLEKNNNRETDVYYFDLSILALRQRLKELNS